MIATNTKTLRLIWLPLCLGAVVRVLYPLGSTFPLNDGGMFYTMVQDLVANGYRLPAYTSYNYAGIPFAYPPAAFYLAAFLSRTWPLLDVLRVLPPLLSVLANPMFYLLARDVLSRALGTDAGQRAAWIATLAYALIPSSFQWQIMGGGLTRSLRYLAALSHALVRLASVRSPGQQAQHLLLGTSAALALAVASHPELGWFSVFSIALIFWARARGDRLRALGSSPAPAPLHWHSPRPGGRWSSGATAWRRTWRPSAPGNAATPGHCPSRPRALRANPG